MNNLHYVNYEIIIINKLLLKHMFLVKTSKQVAQIISSAV